MPSLARPTMVTQKLRTLANLPTLPTFASRAIAAVQQAGSSPELFLAVAGVDPALAVALLRAANAKSPPEAAKVADLATAISVLGMKESSRQIQNVCAGSVVRELPPDRIAACERLWRHSALTALLATQVTHKLGLPLKGEEHVAGLVHDLGRILLAIAYPEVFTKLAQYDGFDEYRLRQHENEVIGVDHTDLGAFMATVWDLPPVLVEAIEFHHMPQDAPNHGTLAAVICVAERLANHMEATRSIDGLDLSENPGWQTLISQNPRLAKQDGRYFAMAAMSDVVPQAQQAGVPLQMFF